MEDRQLLMADLFKQINHTEGVLARVDYLEAILNNIESNFPDILEESVNAVKDAVQTQALKAVSDSPYYRGLLAMATGTGKSRIPIILLKRVRDVLHKDVNYDIVAHPEKLSVLLVVPTEKLRDKNWEEEFKKWGALDIYNVWVERTCYASLHKYKNRTFDLVIGDEFHNLTLRQSQFFLYNKVERLIALTATEPNDKVKKNIFKRLKIPTVYKVSLDVAVRLKMVSDYEVTVIECHLDDSLKCIPGGTKDNKHVMLTEVEAYNALNKRVENAIYGNRGTPLQKTMSVKYAVMARMRFLKTLPRKTEVARFLLNFFIPKEKRTLIFAGGIEQAIGLCRHRFFSKPSAKKTDPKEKQERVARILEHYEGDKWFELFKQGKINQMSCCNAVNEGHNLTEVTEIDYLLVVDIDGNDINIIQRIGRGVRYKVGHKCKIYMIVVVGTVNQAAFREATADLDQSKIKHVLYDDLVSGDVVL